LEEYAAKLESKAERSIKIVTVSADVQGDVSKMENKDMQSLNLFGLPLEVYNRDSSR
jgi:hypothetical protein